MPAPVLLGLVIFSAIWARWSWWTWRRLWRPATTPWEAVVYERGVRRFGRSLWLVMGLLAPLIVAWSRGDELLSAWTSYSVVIHLIVSFPFALWGGYAWGIEMASLAGLTPPAEESQSAQHHRTSR